jgi:hypothetical protein
MDLKPVEYLILAAEAGGFEKLVCTHAPGLLSF